MAKKKKKKKTNFLLTFIKTLATIMVIGIIVFVGWTYAKQTVLANASEKIMEYAIKEEASKYGLNSEKVEEVMKKIDDADKDVIENIVEEHLDKETISQSLELVKNQDAEGLKEYLSNELSQDEMNKIMGMYEKYKDDFDENDARELMEEEQN